ncbi:MAG TPA: hypothetical protein VNR90_03775 [Vicinamibacterales bacterium]|nr:hypothetical protein [Vicinamibacterales bacterium]
MSARPSPPRAAVAFARFAVSAALGVLGMSGLAGCTKHDSLVLLDLRSSGPLGAPVAHIRLSAAGWPTRTVDGSIDAAGFRVGYYGPGNGSGVTVIAQALDAADCVLGSGSATAPALKAGATSDPVTLFVRPQPANGCVPDAGPDTGGGGEDAGTDAEVDAPAEAGTDAEVDTGTDAAIDAGVDTMADAGVDAEADAGTDAEIDAVPDANDDGSNADATSD